MSELKSREALLFDSFLTILLVVVGAATWMVARPIPDNAFEPLGAGFAPRAIAICLIVLGLCHLAAIVVELPRSGVSRRPEVSSRVADTLLTLLVTACFIWIVSEKLIPFWLSTGLFTGITMSLLFRNLRWSPAYAAAGLALGLVLKLAASTVFYVDI